MKIFIISLTGLSLFLVYRFYLLGKQSQDMSPQLGIVDGKLLPCGPKPNCVTGSFQMTDKAGLIEKVKRLKGANIVVVSDNYVHATITSNLFGFVDDLELYFVPDKPEVYYRSASRVGHSDMGQNKKRIDQLIKF